MKNMKKAKDTKWPSGCVNEADYRKWKLYTVKKVIKEITKD
jgi:hypothetical protein